MNAGFIKMLLLVLGFHTANSEGWHLSTEKCLGNLGSREFVDVASLDQLTSGIARSPLAAGSTSQAIIGFSLTSNGNQTVSLIQIDLSNDPTGTMDNFVLMTSADDDFLTQADNAVAVPSAYITIIGSGPYYLNISPTTPLDISLTSDTNFFLVADVGVNANSFSPYIKPTLKDIGIMLSHGSLMPSVISETEMYSFTNAQNSTLQVNYAGQSLITLLEYSNQATSGLTIGNSQRIFAVDVVESDLDALPTNMTSITMQLENHTNISTIALFDNATNTVLPGTEFQVASNIDVNNQITFPVSLVLDDGSSSMPSVRTIDVRITFNPIVTDNQTIGVAVVSVSAAPNGSGFAPVGYVATIPAYNKIDVTATELKFTSLPSQGTVHVPFVANVMATDMNGNIDHDVSDRVDINVSGSGGISGNGYVYPTDGVYTFSSVSFLFAGTFDLTADDEAGGQVLTAAAGSLLISSLGVSVTDGVGSSPLSLNVCYGGEFRPLGSIKIAESDPGDFARGGIFILKLPAGFIFDTKEPPQVTKTGNEILINTLTNYFLSDDIVRISYDVKGTSDVTLDAITITRLKVRYSGPTPFVGGDILVLDASALQIGNTEADGKSHGTLMVTSASSENYKFEVFSFPGQTAIPPDATRFSYTISGVRLKPASANSTTTDNLFSGNGVSFSSAQNSYVFSPSAVGVGDNYDVIYSAKDIDGCLISVTKTFEVYANSISGLESEYCSNDSTTKSLSVDPSEYDIARYYRPWLATMSYGVGNNVNFGGAAYRSVAPSIGIPPPNTAFWTKVGYDFTGEYSITVPLEKSVNTVIAKAAGTVTINCPNHSLTDGTAVSVYFYCSDPFLVINSSYLVSGVTANTFDIPYSFPSGTYSGQGYVTIPNPQITSVLVNTNRILITTSSDHGLSEGVRVRVTIPGLSCNGVSSVINDWYTISKVTRNSFEIECPAPILGTWLGGGEVFINSYRISTFSPSMVNSLNTMFGAITDISVGYFVFRNGCLKGASETCLDVIYSSEQVKLNKPPSVDFGGINRSSAYCEGSASITLTGNQPDGSFTGPGIIDGGFNNNTATFNPAAPNLEIEKPLTISYSYTDNKNCSNTMAKALTVHAKPQPPTPILTKFGYCEGETKPLILKVNGTGSDFAWYDNSSKSNPPLVIGQIFDASFVGTHSPTTRSFYVTQSNQGCESNPVQVDLVIHKLPDADFFIEGQCVNDPVIFKGPSQNISAWNWDFGDGKTSTGQNTNNVYYDSRTYAITLNVTSQTQDGNVVCTNSKMQNLFVGYIPEIEYAFSKICDGDNTQFLHSSSEPLDSVGWDFGDGTIVPLGKSTSTILGVPRTNGTYGNPIHIYATHGFYNTKIVGKTPIGCINSINQTVPVLIKLNPTSTNPYRMDNANPLDEGGYWLAEGVGGKPSIWEFNMPQGTILNSVEKAWITNATGEYQPNDVSYVNSPCFDLTGYLSPVISVWYMNDTQANRDGALLEFSTNSGLTWTILGDPSTGIGWYNNVRVNSLGNEFGWSAAGISSFQEGIHSLAIIPPDDRHNVRFRMKFASDQDTQGEGFVFNKVNIVDKTRKVLIENFTNSSKSSSLNHDYIFRNLDTYFPTTEYVPLEYHIVPAGFGDDPIHDQNTADTHARSAFYGISDEITAVRDGTLTGFFNSMPESNQLSSSFSDQFNLRSLIASPIDIDITTSITTDQKLKIDVTILAKSNISSSDNVVVLIALVEKVVRDPELKGQNGEIEFRYVVRKLLPDAAGKILRLPLTKGDRVVVSEAIHIPEDMFSDINEMAIVAFVQNQDDSGTGNEVLQAALNDLPVQPPLITGTEPEFLQDIQLFPIPATDELNVMLSAAILQDVTVEIIDAYGRKVLKTEIRAGSTHKLISTQKLHNGFYLVSVVTPKGVMQRKVIVTH